MKKRWILYAILLLVLLPLAFVQPRSGAETAVANYQQPITRKELLRLVNEERAKNGIAPLVMDERLNTGAQRKAIEIEPIWDSNRNMHINDQGVHGYSYSQSIAPECRRVSENLTVNIYENTAKRAVDAWIASPEHYSAMIDPTVTMTGFGIKGSYVVEHFCML